MTSDRKINAKITLSQLHCIPLNLINDILSTPHKIKTPHDDKTLGYIYEKL